MQGMSMETDAFELKRMMRQEAHEKAFEIQVMAQRLYEKEKDKIVQSGLQSMNEDFDKKLQKLTQGLNIERSSKVNLVRLKKMKERNDCVEKVKEETRDHILRTVVNPTNPTYRTALKNIIIQGMIKLLEPVLILISRKEDINLVRELIPECQREFEAIMIRETTGEREYKTELRISDRDFLTPENGGECGGIILTSLDRRIVCSNTLKSRLNLCFEELLPQIRAHLFPPKVAPVIATPETKSEKGSSPDTGKQTPISAGSSGKHK